MVITSLLLLIEEAGLSDYFSGLMISALIETSDNCFKGNNIVVLWSWEYLLYHSKFGASKKIIILISKLVFKIIKRDKKDLK